MLKVIRIAAPLILVLGVGVWLFHDSERGGSAGEPSPPNALADSPRSDTLPSSFSTSKAPSESGTSASHKRDDSGPEQNLAGGEPDLLANVERHVGKKPAPGVLFSENIDLSGEIHVGKYTELDGVDEDSYLAKNSIHVVNDSCIDAPVAAECTATKWDNMEGEFGNASDASRESLGLSESSVDPYAEMIRHVGSVWEEVEE